MAFSKKHIPWNKGLKGIHLSSKSEFKVGVSSWNKGKGVPDTLCLDCGIKTYKYDNVTRCKKCYLKSWSTIKITHPRWKIDRSSVKVGERSLNDPLQKQWRKLVKDRDGWKCKIADKNCNGKLEAHHILPWSQFPELRYQINNGIALCHAHHPRKQSDVAKLSPFFQELVAPQE